MKIKKFQVLIYAIISLLSCFATFISFFLNIFYGIMFLCITIFSMMACYYVFCQFSCHYPLNNIQQYLFDTKKDDYGEIKNEQYIIIINQVQKGIFETFYSEKKLIFDLRGFVCKKAYLCSYFVRNYNYNQINKERLKLAKIISSLRLTYLKKYKDVILIIDDKKYYIVKNSQTKFSFLSRVITYSPFYEIIIGRSNAGIPKKLRYFEKIDEKHYLQYKNYRL